MDGIISSTNVLFRQKKSTMYKVHSAWVCVTQCEIKNNGQQMC